MATIADVELEATIKQYILAEFLPGEDPAALSESTPLITSGVLDSIATLKAVVFLEERFGITVAPHEMDVDRLNTIAAMAQFVRDKHRGV